MWIYNDTKTNLFACLHILTSSVFCLRLPFHGDTKYSIFPTNKWASALPVISHFKYKMADVELVYFSRSLEVSNKLEELLNRPEEYSDFHWLSFWQMIFNYLLALLTFLGWAKVSSYSPYTLENKILIRKLPMFWFFSWCFHLFK